MQRFEPAILPAAMLAATIWTTAAWAQLPPGSVTTGQPPNVYSTGGYWAGGSYPPAAAPAPGVNPGTGAPNFGPAARYAPPAAPRYANPQPYAPGGLAAPVGPAFPSNNPVQAPPTYPLPSPSGVQPAPGVPAQPGFAPVYPPPGPQQPVTPSDPLISPSTPGAYVPPPSKQPPPEPIELEKTDSDGSEAFTFKQLNKRVRNMSGRGPNETVARGLFGEGEQLFRQKKYADAAEQYKEAALRWPDSPLEEDSMFMRAESLFFADEYPEANEVYGGLIKKYDSSRHFDKVLARQFDIANYWMQSHQLKPKYFLSPNVSDQTKPFIDIAGRARRLYREIHLADPTGPLADDALMAAGGALFALKRFGEADSYYDELVKTHPNSKYVPAAQLLSIQAKFQQYQGPNYDATPLELAQQRIVEVLAQYPGEIPGYPGEREKLVQLRTIARAQLAERDFAKAEYYRNRKQFNAARYYYTQVTGKYGDTPLAAMAQQQLTEIAGVQDPPPRFGWLDYIFPKRQKRR